MRKKVTAFFLAGTVLVLCLILGTEWGWWHQKATVSSPLNNSFLGLQFVSNEEFLAGKELLPTLVNPGIAYEEVLLPYGAANNTLYLPQSRKGSEWVGMISSLLPDYEVYAGEDNYWQQKTSAIQENHLFTLWLVGDTNYYEFHLVVTGAPVINITTECSRKPEPVEYEKDPEKFAYGSETRYLGTIDVFNPDINCEQYEILQAGVSYHLKGISSNVFEKRGYALDITDSKGENVDVSLLGMRSDNNWKLNALNTDSLCIREKTAAQIWEQFDNHAEQIHEGGPRMEYVELILDNDYRGIYCLVEPVDAKKLKLDQNDILYKIIGWEPPTLDAIQDSVNRGWKVRSPIRIRSPKVITDYTAAWKPMMEYLDIFYYKEELDASYAESIVNVDNLADVFLFTMVTSASDNTFKNLYMAAKVEPDGTYRMHQIPWDLDYTFGNCYTTETNNYTVFDTNYTAIYAETALPRLKISNPERFGTPVLEKWQTYRQDFLATDNVLSLLQENQDYLIETGVILREQERWPESGVNTDIEELLTFQKNRMEWLDTYFENWAK